MRGIARTVDSDAAPAFARAAAGWPARGHGVGLRKEHYAAFSRQQPGVDWLEVISENFFEPGGNPRRVLRRVRERYPVVLHGVSLSIGSADDSEGAAGELEAYLDRLAALCAEVEPAWVSDHLSWGTSGGRNSHDLLPLPYTAEALDHVVARVARVQERLGRRLLLENVSSYLTFRASEMSEWEFLAEVARRADCGILLDLNNVHVSAHNHGFDALAYLEGLPAERVGQYHLAGHRRLGGLLLDTHDHPVPDPVWALYRAALQRIGPRPTLIEWDDHIPPLRRLVQESARARAIEAQELAPAARPRREGPVRG